MDLDACIKERRSVRRFLEKEISKETLLKIVDLARFSPSWKNTQIVRYYMVKDKEVKEKIAEECVLDFAFNAKTIMRCDTLVLVSVVKGLSGYEKDGSFSTSQKDSWEVFDAGIATQTFCLAAHAKGLGSVILGVFDEEKIRRYVPVPKEERVTNLIALGYPNDEERPAPPRKDVESLVSFIG